MRALPVILRPFSIAGMLLWAVPAEGGRSGSSMAVAGTVWQGKVPRASAGVLWGWEVRREGEGRAEGSPACLPELLGLSSHHAWGVRAACSGVQ